MISTTISSPRKGIQGARSELWLAENQEAIESSNTDVEKHGLAPV